MASPDFATDLARWLAVLNDLESSLAAGARAVDGVLELDGQIPWAAPVGLGPLPAELHERAQRLLEAQRAVIPRLEETRRATARHLTLVRNVHTAQTPQRSVYLDVTG